MRFAVGGSVIALGIAVLIAVAILRCSDSDGAARGRRRLGGAKRQTATDSQ